MHLSAYVFLLLTVDVVFLSSENRVVNCLTMPPFRFALGGNSASSVLDLARRTVERRGFRSGDCLNLCAVAQD